MDGIGRTSLNFFYKAHIDPPRDEMIESSLAERARVCRIAAPAAIENIVGVDRQAERLGQQALPGQVHTAGRPISAKRGNSCRLGMRIERQVVVSAAVSRPEVDVARA